MADYQLTSTSIIIREADGACIPADPANTDYQNYLNWVAAGNTADPAPVPVNPSVIPLAAFWARFTPSEQAAIESAASTSPAIANAMTFAAVIGQVNLLSGPIVTSWMANLVSNGIITSARATVILTP